METRNAAMWMVRAERDGHLIDHFLDDGVASLGWGIGDIHPTDANENISVRLRES